MEDRQGTFAVHRRRLSQAEKERLCLSGDIWVVFPTWKSRLNMSGIKPTWQFKSPDGVFGVVEPDMDTEQVNFYSH